MNELTPDDARTITGTPKSYSDRKSVINDVTNSALSGTINRETHSGTVRLGVVTGPGIEQETSPLIGSVSPLDVPLDSARHLPLDSARHVPMDSNLEGHTSLECEECGMEFSRLWLLEHHQTGGLCCGYVSQDDVVAKSVQRESITRQSPLKQSTPIKEPNMEAIRKNIIDEGDKKLRWIACADGNVAKDAVKAGYDTIYKCILYVCRATVENEKVPGQVVPAHNCAFVTVNGQEVKVTEYDVLTDSSNMLVWKPCTVKGALPRGTQVGGYDGNKLMYFIARGKTPDGNHCSGKYVPQDQKCYFAWQGLEMPSETFDFLCKK